MQGVNDFAGLQFNVRYLHDRTDNRGLGCAIDEAHGAIRSLDGLQIAPVLPFLGNLQGFPLLRRQNRTGSGSEVQVIQRRQIRRFTRGKNRRRQRKRQENKRNMFFHFGVLPIFDSQML